MLDYKLAVELWHCRRCGKVCHRRAHIYFSRHASDEYLEPDFEITQLQYILLRNDAPIRYMASEGGVVFLSVL